MTSSSDSISVAVRVRPAKHETDVDEWIIQDQVIYAAQPECQQNVFAFDHILSQEKTNADVYEQVVQPIITSVMAGYHGTVFAYGQTSSGKTHTMMGNDTDPGVTKRAIAQIFDEIHKETHREYLIRISYLEIYNEQIRDLLSNSNGGNLQIKGPDMAVAGLTEQVTTDSDQILHYMTEGDKNRQVGCTNMNERSSRSHSIFRITIESSNRNPETNKRDGVRVSQLNLVDLAGSERATQTGATGTRLREGCHINTSLTALGIVIRKLSTGEKHINFRDSKLTRILQNSLGGNSRTAIICNISPSDYETSLSTLRFGSDAKRIKNKPVINRVLTEDASLLQKRNKEIESLKALISKVETGKEQQLKEKDDTIDKLRKKIEGLEKLAIGGELPPTVSDRNVALIPTRKTDTRRRETWCPGQIAAAATPARTAAAMFDHTTVQDDSFIAKYGTYRDHSDFFTPARPRKRRSDEAFPTAEVGTSSKPDVPPEGDTINLPPTDELEEARKEIAALREELEFVRNEKGLYCGGACTPSLAKRPRLDPPAPVTPVPALSLIREEDSELEDDSPFGTKLKIMATPSQKIQGMKIENRLLKRSLMAVSGCSTPAPYDDTVMTLCNRSAKSETKPETCDAACQYEGSDVGEAGDVDADFQIVQHSDMLCADSPARETPLRTVRKSCKVSSTPLIDFCSPRAVRPTMPTPGRCSEVSWLQSENTPNILPTNVRDVEIQVFFPDETPEVSTRDAETCTDLPAEPEFVETRSEISETRVEESTIKPRFSSIPLEPVERADAEAQTDAEPEKVVPTKCDFEIQVSASTSCCASQACIDMTDADTSTLVTVGEDASTQTTDAKADSTPASIVASCATPPRPAISRFSIVTRCMESPGSACAVDGVRGLDAILGDAPKPSAKKVVTRDVGVMAQIEELWVYKMKLDKEKSAREEAESKLDEVWKERGKLVNTNDKYLEYFRAQGIDPRDVLSCPQGTSRESAKGKKNEDVDTLRKKYDALKEFCFRHPDIKDRMLNDRVLVRQKPSTRTQVGEEKSKPVDDENPVAEVENVEPSTAERLSVGTPVAKSGERPLVELQDMQQFKGAKYLAEANPNECKTS